MTPPALAELRDVRHGIALGVRWAERPSKHIYKDLGQEI